MTTYYIDGTPVTLGSQLGEGGVAIVYAGTGQFSEYALKIWKAFSSIKVRNLTLKKTAHAIGIDLPKNLYKPLGFVTSDRAGKKPVGFYMKLYPTGYLAINELTVRDTWTAYGLTLRDVATVFLNLYDLHVQAHDLGVCFADGNPENFMFHPRSLGVIAGDVDSYQFGPDMPALAGHVEYISPRRFASLPDVALGNNRSRLGEQDSEYLPEHDWWTYMIDFIQSMFRVKPYREGLTGIVDPVTRVLENMHILLDEFSPPLRSSFPSKSMPDEFLEYALAILNTNRVEYPPPRDMIMRMTDPDFWCMCTKDHIPNAGYSIDRSECPVCAKDRTLPAITAAALAVIAEYLVSQFYQAQSGHQLLHAEAVMIGPSDNQAHVLVLIARHHGNKVKVTQVGPKGSLGETTLPLNFSPTQRFYANNESVMVIDQGQGWLFDYSGHQQLEFETEMFMRRPAAGLGLKYPHWMIQAVLTTVGEAMGQLFPNTLQTLTYGNIWFDTSHWTDTLVGFTNWLQGYEWFIIHQNARHTLEVEFTLGEYLTDWRVIFTNKCFAIIRRSQKPHQAEKILATVFNLNRKVVYEEVLPSSTDLRNLALQKDGTLVVPTEKGLFQRTPTGKPEALVGTENIPSTAKVVIINGRIVVIDEDSSVYLVKQKK